MLPFKSFLFGLLAASLAVAAPTPDNLLGEVIDALGIGLVTSIEVTLTLDTLSDNLVSISFEAQNPLPFELTLDTVSTSAGLNGTTYASFDHSFGLHPVVVPPLGKANSGNITNVPLTQGVDASLAIIPFGVLDLQEVDINVRAGSIFGIGGVPLVISGLKQTNVPTTYNLDLS
ncbi:hypothetical protein C8F04DRAFT_1240262 [Mycena alexandri]|uniref:Late embryogenesis abundant protein LEA-2 subgroup domain-containing protein n=1 Tax=Mycena alexandri TaxID=1745969 RepID=A0AAD6WTT0_9AGAR|nr:hypothetical protein C8F04DRAFT_1240262 [Mycena alexandri]